ncbi:MAG: hypothetical protein V4507_06190 [Verrucomicrobiota bacterium]
MKKNWIYRLFIGIGLVFQLQGETPDLALEDSWKQASLFLFSDAYQKLTETKTLPVRQGAYAKAILLLNLQPKTESNVQQAAEILRHLITEKKDDEVGIASKYFLGRIAQIHQETPDPVLAEKIYRELIQEFPQSPLVEQVVIKLTLIRLYSNLTPLEIPKRLAEVEELGGLVKTPAAQVCYHLLLSDYIIRLGGNKETALAHLMAAEHAGIRRSTSRGDTYVRIGMLARELGKKAIAQTYFKKFTDEFQRDVRAFAVKTLLAELQSGGQK